FLTVAASPDGRWVTGHTYTEPNTVTLRVMELASGRQRMALGRPVTDWNDDDVFGRDGCRGLPAISADGRLVAAVRVDGPNEFAIWDAQSGDAVTRLRGHDRYVTGLAFSPDGKWLA